VMPWILVLPWAFISPRGRSMVLWNPNVRLFLFMIPWNILLIRQDIIVGSHYLQGLHYDRGYLQFSLVVVAWQWVRTVVVWGRNRWHTRNEMMVRFWPRMRRRLLPGCVLLLCLDQAMFLTKQIMDLDPVGYVPQYLEDAIRLLPGDATDKTVFNDGAMRCTSYITASTNYVTYDAPETMVVPYPEEHSRVVNNALRSGKGLAELGIGYALISGSNDYAIKAFEKQGWQQWKSVNSDDYTEGLVILRPPWMVDK